MNKIIVIGGLTATCKTKLAIEVAKKFNGELINADSRQIYKYLDIGTNKEAGSWKFEDGVWEIENIPIHLVNIINPNQRFSVYEYQQLAFKAIEDILKRGKLPILVGGTGLYIDSILQNYELQITNYENNEN